MKLVARLQVEPWPRGGGVSSSSEPPGPGRRRLAASNTEPSASDEASAPVPTLREVEQRHIEHVLAISGGRPGRAARLLGLTRWALGRRLTKLGLRPPRQVPRLRMATDAQVDGLDF